MITDDLIEELLEQELYDHLFGDNNKRSRTEFLENLSKEEANWIMDSELIRAKVRNKIRSDRKKEGLSEIFRMDESITPDKTK